MKIIQVIINTQLENWFCVLYRKGKCVDIIKSYDTKIISDLMHAAYSKQKFRF